MKKILAIAALSMSLLVGCGDGLTNREATCLEKTGNIHCTSQEQYQIEHERAGNQMMGGYQEREYPEVTNVNYYGHPDHGSWVNGSYQFHNPNGVYASQTNSFLMGAALGGLAAYALTSAGSRDGWTKANKGGWKKKSNNYVSKKEKARRKAQSIKDKKAYKAKQKKAAKVKAKKQKQLKRKKLNKVKNKPLQKKRKPINLSKKPKKSNVKKSSYSKSRSKPKKQTRGKSKSRSKRR